MTQNRRRILQILNAFYFFRIYIFSKFDVIFCFSNVKKLADKKLSDLQQHNPFIRNAQQIDGDLESA